MWVRKQDPAAGHLEDRLDPVEGLEAWIEEDPEALESWLWGIKQ